MSNVWIVGFGRVGHLIYSLEKQLHSTIQVFTKSGGNRIFQSDQPYTIPTRTIFLLENVDRIWICVSDDAIEEIIQQMKKIGIQTHLAIHTSGWHSPKLLESIVAPNQHYLSFHPMTSIGHSATQLNHALVSLCGTGGGLEFGLNAAKILQCQSIVIDETEKKPLHLLCQFASNVPYALLAAALELGKQTSVPTETLLYSIKQMLTDAVNNVLDDSVHKFATGPIARGDEKFIDESIEFLRKHPKLLQFYLGYVQYLTSYFIQQGDPIEKLQQWKKIQQKLEESDVSSIMD